MIAVIAEAPDPVEIVRAWLMVVLDSTPELSWLSGVEPTEGGREIEMPSSAAFAKRLSRWASWLSADNWSTSCS